jgi:hypothetical protein
MPTSAKRSREFFYIGRGGRSDAALHNAILAAGDGAAAKAVTIARMKRRGWSESDIAALLGTAVGDAYDPGELRDPHGKWTSGGGATPDVGIKASGIDAADAIKAQWAAQTPVDSLDKLMQHGPGDQQALAAAATEIQQHTGAEFINPGVKTRARTQEKIDGGRPASTITDVVRGGFKVTTPEQADAVVAGLAKRFTVADEGWAKTPVGYFDRKLMLKFASGIVGEVQLWHPELLEAKEKRGGHEMYVQWSKAKKAGDAPRTKVLDEGMKALYKGVTDHLPAAWSGIVGK